jgi:hypothetical protein
MGRIRRGGYIFMWWIGDHPPRHLHVFDKDQKLITRVNLETLQPLDMPTLPKRVAEIIRELQREGHI